MIKKYFFACCFLIFFGTINAQSTTSFSDLIIGNWVGNGTLFGQKATFKMLWEYELNDKFIKLIFENSFEDGSGIERVMRANAYYDFKQNKGFWFDSRGLMLPISMIIEDHAMTVLWGDDTTEKGKTIYSIIDNEHIKVEDFVFKDNKYLPFGEAEYVKLEK